MSNDSIDNLDLGATGRYFKADTGDEFFSVGVPLHAVRAGYIKRQADDALYEIVSSGHFAHVLAPDRSGKSSLIAATTARLEMNGLKVAVLDLAQIGERDAGSDSGRWFYNVAYRLMRQLRIRFDLQEWWQDKSVLSNRQRLFEFYTEVILHHVSEQIVIFIDEIQCVDYVPDADQLLASIRSAHNARATNPDFTRLSFALFGECDPLSLVEEPEASPFNVTQQILLHDFSRQDLDVFSTELNLSPEKAVEALDRIYFWTQGQPYLCQKMARAVARDMRDKDVASFVDHVALHQLSGRAALHNEPHMSHIHRAIMRDRKQSEAVLNLYGKLRKGIDVDADLGSAPQRRLMAVGLVVIDENSKLRVRNRLYEGVFTTRWANENLSFRVKTPLLIAASILLISLIPFWYTQWLPGPYVRAMTDTATDVAVAEEAYRSLSSFPAHDDIAQAFYRNYLQQRAESATDLVEISELAQRAAMLPNANRFPDELEAGYWERQAALALRSEKRDDALIAKINALALATTQRRKSAAALVGDDYPLLLATLPQQSAGTTVFDASGMVLTTAVGAAISQWSWTADGIRERPTWSATALDVSPLVRRVIIDREGFVNRAGLTLNISHSRIPDLRIKVIAPSGRTVEVKPNEQSASSNDDIQIPAAQLQSLVGESVQGTWTISLRDENLGVAGRLVGWNLKLNAQGAVEHFERGLNIPDPEESEADEIWFDTSGRYAVARTQRSDTARIWDLSFAEPIQAVAITENEVLLGFDAASQRLVTATQDSVNIWNTVTGDRVTSLAIGAPSATARLTQAGEHLLVERRSQVGTELELWSIESGSIVAELSVAGPPFQIAIDDAGSRVAIADFDRAVRVWDFSSGELLGQFDLSAQARDVRLSADGSALGVVYLDTGVSLWQVENPAIPLLERFANFDWALKFSPSGNTVAIGNSETGYQIYDSADGRMLGPPLGLQPESSGTALLAFSADEQLLLTGASDTPLRFWNVGDVQPPTTPAENYPHALWRPSADQIARVSPDGSMLAIGDRDGHVHFVSVPDALGKTSTLEDEISYFGHAAPIESIVFSPEGTLAVSNAGDNSIRVWSVATGQPRAFDLEVAGSPIRDIAVSADSTMAAVTNDDRVIVFSLSDGEVAIEHELAGRHDALVFADNGDIFLGAASGALSKASRSVDRGWEFQQVWQGEAAIRLLQVSPNSDYLITVDAENTARQILLRSGLVADSTLPFSSAIREVVFAGHGNRVYFRSSRWVHRATVSTTGLHWIDASMVPAALEGAGLVFVAPPAGEDAIEVMALPSAVNGEFALTEVDISAPSTSGLIGTRDELLTDWQSRVSAPRRAAF